MRYAALGPGKRIRPVLTLAVADLFGAPDLEPAVDLGAAVEWVHACSLVLDDLPAMDDAELRRGRPAVHRVFGESVALLGALALLNEAFALVAATAPRLGPSHHPAAALIRRLADAIGTRGLIGGQALDLESRPGAFDFARARGPPRAQDRCPLRGGGAVRGVRRRRSRRRGRGGVALRPRAGARLPGRRRPARRARRERRKWQGRRAGCAAGFVRRAPGRRGRSTAGGGAARRRARRDRALRPARRPAPGARPERWPGS